MLALEIVNYVNLTIIINFSRQINYLQLTDNYNVQISHTIKDSTAYLARAYNFHLDYCQKILCIPLKKNSSRTQKNSQSSGHFRTFSDKLMQ